MTMPKSAMTWDSPNRRWLKNYREKMYSRSCRQLKAPPTEQSSVAAANHWWVQKQAELDANEEEKAKNCLLSNLAFFEQKLAEFSSSTLTPPLPASVRIIPYEIVQDAAPKPQGNTIGDWVSSWLEKQKGRVDAKEITPDRWGIYKYDVEYFKEWAGSAKAIEKIDAVLIDKYHQHLTTEIGKREQDAKGKAGFSRKYAKGRLDTMRQFVRWLYQLGKIPLPGNLVDNKQLRIALKASPPKQAAIDDVKAVLNASDGMMKLYLLLMLNCGMYQSDIANLQKSEMDWKEGRITRKRSKTQKHNNVPVVGYKLWDETVRLLNEHKSDHDTFVLTNRKGNQLVRKWIGSDNKPKKTCNITSEYKRFRKSNAELPAIPLSLLRKTSSNLLFNHEEYMACY